MNFHEIWRFALVQGTIGLGMVVVKLKVPYPVWIFLELKLLKMSRVTLTSNITLYVSKACKHWNFTLRIRMSSLITYFYCTYFTACCTC